MLTPTRGKHINGFLSHDALAGILWQHPDNEPEWPAEVVRSVMAQLRKKLFQDIIIRNVPRRGYEMFFGLLSDPGPYFLHRFNGHSLLGMPSPQIEAIFARLVRAPARPAELLCEAEVHPDGNDERRTATLRVLLSQLRSLLRDGWRLQYTKEMVYLHKPQ